MFTTLPPVFHHLGADVSMKICPVCPNCSKVFPSPIPPNYSCDRCAHSLFQTKVKPASKQQRTEPPQVPKPHLQFPSKSIEDYLTTMLAVPGMEDEMEAWRKKTRVQGTYTDIFDGEVCRTIKGVDGSPFFHLAAGVLEPNELRIGVSLAAGSSLFISSAILPLLRRSLKVFLPAESNFSIAHVLSHQPEHRQPASTSQVLLIDCLALRPIQHHFQVSYFKCTPSRHHSWPKGTQPRRYTGISCDRCQ